jgi:hypothetical protein
MSEWDWQHTQATVTKHLHQVRDLPGALLNDALFYMYLDLDAKHKADFDASFWKMSTNDLQKYYFAYVKTPAGEKALFDKYANNKYDDNYNPPFNLKPSIPGGTFKPIVPVPPPFQPINPVNPKRPDNEPTSDTIYFWLGLAGISVLSLLVLFSVYWYLR